MTVLHYYTPTLLYNVGDAV